MTSSSASVSGVCCGVGTVVGAAGVLVLRRVAVVFAGLLLSFVVRLEVARLEVARDVVVRDLRTATDDLALNELQLN